MKIPLPNTERLARLARHEAILGCAFVAVVAWAAVADPGFLALQTQRELSTHVWELAILALPMTLVILAGGIDLSVGSIMALAAVSTGMLWTAGWPVWLAAGAGFCVGVAAGFLNGCLVAGLAVHPLIVTLATMAAFRGIAEGVSKGRPYSGFPETFIAVGRGTLAGVPIPGLIFGVLALGTAVFLSRTPRGRMLYAVGANETAVRFAGGRVGRIRIGLHTAVGAAAGLAAVLYVARRNTAKADVGTGIELDVITAVVLGGVSITGGRGRLAGALAGVFAIHEVREFVGWHWNRDELVLIVVGALLIASVATQNLLDNARRR